MSSSPFPSSTLTAEKEHDASNARMWENRLYQKDVMLEVAGHNASSLDSFRFWWSTTSYPTLIGLINLIVSFGCVVVYIFQAYYSGVRASDTALEIIYLIASITYSIEFVLAAIVTPHTLDIFFSKRFLLNLICISYGIANFILIQRDAHLVAFFKALRLFYVLRFANAAIRIFMIWVRLHRQPNEVALFEVVFKMLMLVVWFLLGMAIYFFELNPYTISGMLYFHEAVYWASVTVAGIGYGDYSPDVWYTQMLIPTMLVMFVLIIPSRASLVISIAQNVNYYVRRSYSAKTFGRHVVVLGYFDTPKAKTIIDEFYHPDKGYQTLDMVMMLNRGLATDMRSMMQAQLSHKRLIYIQGSVFSSQDLKRCSICEALAVFVACNKYTLDPEAADRQTLKTVLAVSEYIRQYTGVTPVYSWTAASWAAQMRERVASRKQPLDHMPRIIVQFHLPETVERAKGLLDLQMSHPPELGGLPVKDNRLFPICIGTLKHLLAAYSTLSPGLPTLIANLVISCRITRPDWLGRERSLVKGMGWLEEYLTGAGNEVYEVNFPTSYQGLSFEQAAQRVFNNHSVILMAIGTRTADGNLLMAPFEDIKLINCSVHVGYVLADEQVFLSDTLQTEPNDPENVLLGLAPTAQKAKIHTTDLLFGTESQRSAVPIYQLFRRGFEEKVESFKFKAEEQLVDMLDPIIITGTSCFNFLSHMITAIRSSEHCRRGASEGACKRPIIIMSGEAPTDSQAALILDPEGVHFVLADPSELISWHRLGIVEGSSIHAVILPNSSDWEVDLKGTESAMIDRRATNPSYTDFTTIQILSNLRLLCNVLNCSMSVMSEAFSRMNATYLSSISWDTGNIEAVTQTNPSNRSVGRRNTSNSFLSDSALGDVDGADRLTAWKGFWIRVSNCFDKEYKRGDELRELLNDMPYLAPPFSSGTIMDSSFLDNLFINSLFNPLLLRVVSSLIGARETQMEPNSTTPRAHTASIKSLIKASAHLEQMWQAQEAGEIQVTFADLFFTCLRMKAVPIALYRRDIHTKFPYIYTNPARHTVLREDDDVFLLASIKDMP